MIEQTIAIITIDESTQFSIFCLTGKIKKSNETPGEKNKKEGKNMRLYVPKYFV